MNLQLTNAGVAALIASAGPVQLQAFNLGSAYNYIPLPTDVALHGSALWAGTPTPFTVINPNLVKYSVYLDYTVGPFNFGEIGLYFTANGVTNLFALGSSDTLISKLATGISTGNSIRIDLYLSMVGQNYSMFLDLAESNNTFRMATLDSVDYLPPSQNAVPNVYIIKGATSSQSAILAYTDRNALWNFDVYQYGNKLDYTITAASSNSITLLAPADPTVLEPIYFGQIILEFLSGSCYSICRNVGTVILVGQSLVISFVTPLAVVPVAGDRIRAYSRQAISTMDVIIPIATTTKVGGVVVGSSLIIDLAGNLNINPANPTVVSVNGYTGTVTLAATDIKGFATVATSGLYSDLKNVPTQYTLPVATTTVLGGVTAPISNNLVITNQGSIDLSFNPVKTVNSTNPDASGNIAITIPPIPAGLLNPTAISNNADLNTYTTTGLFYNLPANTLTNNPQSGISATLEVITSTGNTLGVIQRWTSATAVYYRGFTSPTWGLWNAITVGNIVNEYFFTGSGFTPNVTTSLQLANSYGSVNNVGIHFDGVFQGPDTYSLNGNTLTFASAIPAVQEVYIRGGLSLPIGVPSDGTVTVPKLSTDVNAYFAKIGSVNVFTGNQSVAPVLIIPSPNVSINAALSNNFKTVLVANSTVNNPTNLTDGMSFNLRIKQDTTGNRLLTYGSMFKFVNGVVPTVSTSASAVDILSCYYDSLDNVLNCKLNNNYA